MPMSAVRAGFILTAIAACGLSPAAASAQSRSGSAMQPASRWTLRLSAGRAVAGPDESRAGPQVHVAIERTLTDKWDVRVQSRILRIGYDPATNRGVTSTAQFEFGLALVKMIERSESALSHVYVGGGASFLSSTFGGIVAPRNNALGVLGLVGLEFHPTSRRWGAFTEVSWQVRSTPPEISHGILIMNQIGIAFGASIPIHRGRHP
jgi:hypothetical protein